MPHPPSLPRPLLLLALAVLSLALVACGGGDDGVLEGATLEVSQPDDDIEEVDSFDDVEEAVGFEVPLPFELPEGVSIGRVLAVPDNAKLGPLVQFFLDPEGTAGDSTVTVSRNSPPGSGEGSETDLGGTPGYFTAPTSGAAGGEQAVLQWQSCNLWYAMVSPGDASVDDIEDVARAFVEACEA